MPSGDALRGLLERVRAASGPDRELDAAIEIALVRPAGWVSRKEWVAADERWFRIFPPQYLTASCSVAQFHTKSIDAALALVERVLPGWEWTVGLRDPETLANAWAELFGPIDEIELPRVTAQSPPLAILAALLQALITREANHAD